MNSGKLVDAEQKKGGKKLESEPALSVLPFTGKMSWQSMEIFTLMKRYAPLGRGSLAGLSSDF